MSSHICLRCLVRPSIPATKSSHAASRSERAFSTSSVSLAKAAPVAQSKRVANNKSFQMGRRGQAKAPSAPARKTVEQYRAARKRIVLSNTNALEVQGLRELSVDNAADESSIGQVLTLDNDSIDALRAAEAFKHTQGWSWFRQPSTLVTIQANDVATLINKITEDKSSSRELIVGEKNSGKSVLALQAMTFARQKGWTIIHIPEGQELSLAHTSYAAQRIAGRTMYTQPEYMAKLLSRIAKSNPHLSDLTISQQHTLPVPLQSNISLLRLAELGAADAQIAWPVFNALKTELLQPSSEAHPRPPLLFTLDGIPHLSGNSKYLDREAKPIHSFDLALIDTFMSFINGKSPLPNGGMIWAIDSRSNRPSANALDYAIEYASARIEEREALLAAESEALKPEREAVAALKNEYIAFGAGHRVKSDSQGSTQGDSSLPVLSAEEFKATLQSKRHAHQERHEALLPRLQAWTQARQSLDKIKASLASKRAFYSPYQAFDTRVEAGFRDVKIREVKGLGKEETRGVMEYWAKSGIMRGSVDEKRVGVEWALAGGGVVGELEGSLVRDRV